MCDEYIAEVELQNYVDFVGVKSWVNRFSKGIYVPQNLNNGHLNLTLISLSLSPSHAMKTTSSSYHDVHALNQRKNNYQFKG